MIWKSHVLFYYFWKYVKQRFPFNHKSKVVYRHFPEVAENLLRPYPDLFMYTQIYVYIYIYIYIYIYSISSRQTCKIYMYIYKYILYMLYIYIFVEMILKIPIQWNLFQWANRGRRGLRVTFGGAFRLCKNWR